MPTPSAPRVICLFGPTASGKTAAAIGLAERMKGEIINADSRQVYRHTPVIAACPSPDEYAQAPHHLFAYLAPSTRVSAGLWAEDARQRIEEVLARGHTPLVVGGTGFYFKTLMGGLHAVPTVPPEVEARFAHMPAAVLHQHLQQVDPLLAQRLSPTDTQRLIRALAVEAHTGVPLSRWQQHQIESPPPYTFLTLAIAPPRALLHQRIAQRWGGMKEAGVVQEAEALRQMGYTLDMPGLSGLGIAELFDYLDGRLDWETTTERVLAKTRQYAKRQITWLRHQYPAHITAESAAELLARVL